mmetsp:Transcript_44195/g.53401  ORF Transcript_44195/g.53401 Transcript_44195/m.53401 type:complete len:237 (+) Transcript_44195:541-1251(+)
MFTCMTPVHCRVMSPFVTRPPFPNHRREPAESFTAQYSRKWRGSVITINIVTFLHCFLNLWNVELILDWHGPFIEEVHEPLGIEGNSGFIHKRADSKFIRGGRTRMIVRVRVRSIGAVRIGTIRFRSVIVTVRVGGVGTTGIGTIRRRVIVRMSMTFVGTVRLRTRRFFRGALVFMIVRMPALRLRLNLGTHHLNQIARGDFPERRLEQTCLFVQSPRDGRGGFHLRLACQINFVD